MKASRAHGFFVVDAVMAGMILAIAAGAAGAVMAAQAGARRRAEIAEKKARCIDELIVRRAADPSVRNDACDEEITSLLSSR